MKIYFYQRKIEKLFNSKKEFINAYGDLMFKKFQSRRVALEAAQNLNEYRSTDKRCHELTGDRKGQIAIDLVHPFRLIFEPTDPPPLKNDGGLN
ncbi:MAG: killer suppression protein [Planctomycetia bacterium]|nr:killer suppression protein [Planctomycetia bacterium]